MTTPKRLLYIINHRTLVPAEVPILQDLGWEIFSPKIVPGPETDFTSASVTYEYDGSLTIPKEAITALNRHDFFKRRWSPTISAIINESFDVIVVSFSVYLTPMIEAVKKFHGLVIARPFGREEPYSYTDYFVAQPRAALNAILPLRGEDFITEVTNTLESIRDSGDRFVFGQAYDNLAEIEVAALRDRAHTIAVPLPKPIYEHTNRWTGKGDKAIFVCPAIREAGYYRTVYESIKRDFSELPHLILGRQTLSFDDPAVLGFVTDEKLFDLYAETPVFIYLSTEPRHVHYSPIEAMVVGAPVLYRKGCLLDALTEHHNAPGACSDTAEMRRKAQSLIGGDRTLADEIRDSQEPVANKFSADLVKQQWASILPNKVALHA